MGSVFQLPEKIMCIIESMKELNDLSNSVDSASKIHTKIELLFDRLADRLIDELDKVSNE